MKFLSQLNLILLLLVVNACNNTAQQPELKAAAKPEVKTPSLEQALAADLQTLTENHNILIIRVAGDQSKLSEATKSKIKTQTQSFNAAFEQLKAALVKRGELLTAMEKAVPGGTSSTPESISPEIKSATEAVDQARDQYDEQARQFAVLIEEVKKVRGR